MRIEIGAQRDADQADVILAPCHVAGNRIYADVQNLGIQGGELSAARIEFGHLHRSSRGPVEGMKSNKKVLFAKIVARADGDPLLPGNGWKLKLRGGIANLQRHRAILNDGGTWLRVMKLD